FILENAITIFFYRQANEFNIQYTKYEYIHFCIVLYKNRTVFISILKCYELEHLGISATVHDERGQV
ncbi:hypothetical protein, partial [Acidaminococcus fermentans]|uniref:hypothetical protein n=1 Tax=Acidaminococcus fermentans TaxID=905 RepID=UPI003080206F